MNQPIPNDLIYSIILDKVTDIDAKTFCNFMIAISTRHIIKENKDKQALLHMIRESTKNKYTKLVVEGKSSHHILPNGWKHGLYEYNGSKTKIKARYRNNILHGSFIKSHKTKRLESTYFEGVLHGECREFNNDYMMSYSMYNNGYIKNEYHYSTYYDGNIDRIFIYDDNVFQAFIFDNSSDNNLRVYLTKINGKLNNEHYRWENGGLIKITTYKDDIKHGKVERYEPTTGQLIKEYSYYNGVRHGPYKKYSYEDDITAIKVRYYEHGAIMRKEILTIK
jgi:antitoxin component YwqK of YwqJK toxin-antitoxin module